MSMTDPPSARLPLEDESSHAGWSDGEKIHTDAVLIIETAKSNGPKTEGDLAGGLAQINDQAANRLEDLLPWSWVRAQGGNEAA